MKVVIVASVGMAFGMGAMRARRRGRDARQGTQRSQGRRSRRRRPSSCAASTTPRPAKFLEAYNKKPFPAFLFNVAVSYEKAKQLDKAKEYFERYLHDDPNASDAAQVRLRLDVIGKLLAPPPPPRARRAAPPRARNASTPSPACADRRAARRRPAPAAPPAAGTPRRPRPPRRHHRRRCSPTSTPRGWW